MKVKKLDYTTGFETIKVPFLDPDKLVESLIKAGLTISERHVTEFWDKKRHSGETWAAHSPASSSHIPIAIYGDSCRLYASRADTKFLGIFISFPLWRPRSTRYSRWCIFCLENSKLYGQHTLFPVLQRLTYKLNMLFENGVPGLDGRAFRCAVTEIRGDWEWHKQLFNLSSTWKGVKNVCFRCNCSSRSDNPKNLYYCLDEDPDWKEFTLAEFPATEIKHDAPTCVSITMFGQTLFILFFVLHGFSETHIDIRVNRFDLARSSSSSSWVPSWIAANMQHACSKPWADVWFQWFRLDTWQYVFEF